MIDAFAAYGQQVTKPAPPPKLTGPILTRAAARSVYAEIVAVGRTSMRIEVEAWRRPRDSLDASKVTQAAFTFVALGPDRRPVPVPPIRAN